MTSHGDCLHGQRHSRLYAMIDFLRLLGSADRDVCKQSKCINFFSPTFPTLRYSLYVIVVNSESSTDVATVQATDLIRAMMGGKSFGTKKCCCGSKLQLVLSKFLATTFCTTYLFEHR